MWFNIKKYRNAVIYSVILFHDIEFYFTLFTVISRQITKDPNGNTHSTLLFLLTVRPKGSFVILSVSLIGVVGLLFTVAMCS